MPKLPRFAVSVLVLQLWSAQAQAQAQANDTSIVRQFERGFHLTVAPSVYFTTGGR